MAASAAKLQDLPPCGGYRPINYKRVPPKAYMGGWAVFGGYLGMTSIAAYLYYLNCKVVKMEEIEMRSARNVIHALLLAERDREYLKQLRRNRDEEGKLMANVEGWKVGTLYGEPLYKNMPTNWLDTPSYQGYYVHADVKDMNKRGMLGSWS